MSSLHAQGLIAQVQILMRELSDAEQADVLMWFGNARKRLRINGEEVDAIWERIKERRAQIDTLNKERFIVGKAPTRERISEIIHEQNRLHKANREDLRLIDLVVSQNAYKLKDGKILVPDDIDGYEEIDCAN